MWHALTNTIFSCIRRTCLTSWEKPNRIYNVYLNYNNTQQCQQNERKLGARHGFQQPDTFYPRNYRTRSSLTCEIDDGSWREALWSETRLPIHAVKKIDMNYWRILQNWRMIENGRFRVWHRQRAYLKYQTAAKRHLHDTISQRHMEPSSQQLSIVLQ